MREHTHLSAMVGFVSEHVAEHLQANRPWGSPAVPVELLDAISIQRFREHLCAASGTLGQSLAGLLRRAPGAVELWRNLEVRSGEPDPFGADVVHVGEDGRNGASVGWWFRFPDIGVKMFDEKLVHAIVGGEDLDRGPAELSVNLVLARGHGSYSLTYSTSGPTATGKLDCNVALSSV